MHELLILKVGLDFREQTSSKHDMYENQQYHYTKKIVECRLLYLGTRQQVGAWKDEGYTRMTENLETDSYRVYRE